MENTTKNNEEILNNALDYITKEDYLSAEALLKKITQKEPEQKDDIYIEAQKNLGLVEVNLDNPQGAIKAFEKALEFNKDDATSLFYLANCYSQIGQKETAIEHFEEVLKLRPDYLDVYKTMGMIYIEFSQYDEAAQIVKRALLNKSIVPDRSLYYIIATAYMLKKEHPKAIEYLEKAVELEPDFLPILNSLSVCYMNNNEYEKAYEILKRAIELDKNNSMTTYNLGRYYKNKNDYKTALEYMQLSYRQDPSISMLATVAEFALKAEEYEFAATSYQNLVSAYPNNTKYRTSYVSALEMTGKYQEALDNTDILLLTDPKNINLIKKKGTYLRKLKRYEESVEMFDILLKRGKIDIEVYYNLAFNYVETGDFDNAKEMFKKCIILEPQNPYAHKDLGVLYLKMNCYDWAVDEMKEAIALEEDVAEFHYSLGVSYMMLANHTDARVAFERALELEPDDPECLAYLGYLNLIENKKEEAYQLLQKAIKVDPTNFLAKTYIAKYYFQDKKYEIAKQFLLDMTQITKDDETMNMLAICYMETQDWQNAVGIFYKLSKEYSNNHILLTNLARCEYKCGKTQEAQEHLRQALMIFDDYDQALKLLEEINNGK